MSHPETPIAPLTDGRRALHAGSPEENLAGLAWEIADVPEGEDWAGAGAGLDLLAHATRVAPEAVRNLRAGSARTELASEAQGREGAFRLLPEPPSEANAGAARPARERAKRFLDHLLPLLPAAALEMGPDGLVRHANGVAQLVFGQSEDQLMGRPALQLGVPCRQSQCACQTFDAPPCSNREVASLETWGHERTFLWSCEGVRTKDGSGGGCAASFLDITERPGLEVKIFHAKHEIEAIFDSVTDPTFLVDAAGRILRANRALAHHVGRPFREILGRPCAELLASRRDGCAECPMERVFETGTEAHDEVRLPDGRIYKIHVFPIVKRGLAERAVIRYQDVTAERELEQRLLQAEKMASIGQLSAGIAHEINNPMGYISANLELLTRYAEDLSHFGRATHLLAAEALSGDRDPRVAWLDYTRERADLDMDYILRDLNSLVGECRKGAERIRDIVGDLRAFSHPNENEWEASNLHEGLESALNILRSELKNRCDVVRDYGELPKIRCSPQQLNQVFLNLLINAAQAIPGRGTVTVRTRASDDRVTVDVTDTGTGIAPEDLTRIFDPFFTTKPVGQGTGLGLHLALGIVKKHGGELRVSSSPGKGSTFSVVLPVDPRTANGSKGPGVESAQARPRSHA